MVSNKAAIAVLALACCMAVVNSQHVGGLDEEKPADGAIQEVIKKVAGKVQEKYPGGFKSIEPVSYKTQVVAGMNYFVKVKITDNKGQVKHAHLRLYRPFNPTLGIEVHQIKTDVTEESPLKYF